MNPIALITRLFSLTTLMLGTYSISSAAFITTQLNQGTYTLSNNVENMSLPAPITINRLAAGYGSQGGAAEGVWTSYTFQVPSNGIFDVQNNLHGIWTGWGSSDNGPWQSGPTTSSWDRGVRYQHRYPGLTPTSTVTLVGGIPSPDSNVTPNLSLLPPSAGDQLKLTAYFDTVHNKTFSEYLNLTTGESFSYVYENFHPSLGNTLTFNQIMFRSDTPGLRQFEYAYGTFVIPEPHKALFLTMSLAIMCQWRRRA